MQPQLSAASPKAKPRPGAAWSNARVYSCRGFWKTSASGPCSTTRPDCITTTRSQICAATRRSCVMNTSVRLQALLDVLEQRQDLRLYRDVQRRHGFVCDQDLRLDGQRARNADALALAAGKFVRIAVERTGRQLHQAPSVPPRVARRSPRVAPKLSGPSEMAAPTVRRGLSERYGS